MDKSGLDKELEEIKRYTQEQINNKERIFAINFQIFLSDLKDKLIESKYWKVIDLKDMNKGDVFTYQSNDDITIHNHHRHILLILDKVSTTLGP